MYQDVDPAVLPADLVHRCRDALRIEEVDGMVSNAAARRAHRPHRLERRLRALESGQLALDERRRRTLAAGPEAVGEITLETVAVAREARDVGIVLARRGDAVEQVERAARRGRQVGDDGRHDPSCRAGHHEYTVPV